jgi:hypothetical protein
VTNDGDGGSGGRWQSVVRRRQRRRAAGPSHGGGGRGRFRASWNTGTTTLYGFGIVETTMPPIAKALGVTLTITTTTAHHGRVRREYDRECFGSAASWRLEEALREDCTKSLVESEIFDRTLRRRFSWISVRLTAFLTSTARTFSIERMLRQRNFNIV